MSISGHVFFTWLAAHAIHPFVWMIALMIMSGGEGFGGLYIVITICLVALVFSIPAIFFFWLVNKLIINSALFPSEKFLLWLISAPLITAINAFGLIMLTGDDPYMRDTEMFLFTLPSIIATAISVAVRYKEFFALNKQITEAKQTS